MTNSIPNHCYTKVRSDILNCHSMLTYVQCKSEITTYRRVFSAIIKNKFKPLKLKSLYYLSCIITARCSNKKLMFLAKQIVLVDLYYLSDQFL